MLYLGDVVHSEGWRQLVSVSESDLIGCSLQGDLCPQEETAPHSVPVEDNIPLEAVSVLPHHSVVYRICDGGLAMGGTQAAHCS